MSDFEDGFRFFQHNAGDSFAAFHGADYGTGRAAYVDSVDQEISALEESINAFFGDHTPAKQLKGDIAEFWHAGTFNVNAATNESGNRAIVDRSNEFGSVDVSSNFGKDFGLKYYANAEESAKHQAISVFQRFKMYQSKGGKDSLEKFLTDRHYTAEDVLNDPVYQGQVRVIPKDQLEEATTWLKRMIATESARRPDQVKRYQDTLDLLSDCLADNDGSESIPLSREDAEKLAVLAKEGKFKAEDFDISAPELLNLELLVKESLKAGISAAVISLVLKVGPEVLRSIDYLIKNGEIDEDQFRRIGFAAITGSSEGFIRGSVAAAITACCKSGLWGETFKELNPGIVGTIVAVTMNTVKNAYQVAIGKKTRTELSNELIQDLFVSSAALAGGYAGQAVLHQLPVVGYLIGSFVGSVAGSFVYSTGYKAVISFCTETGVTLFGLVEQDYSLPDDIIAEMGIETFDYERFEPEKFEPETFTFDTFEADTFKPENIGITFLRRGVIGVSKIGYV
jgi:hypothetical protein